MVKDPNGLVVYFGIRIIKLLVIQLIREIIKKAIRDITEQIKWIAPSFSYKGESLVTFHLWAREHIHLVFHNPMISKVNSKLLAGDYDHRRMAYFADRKDIDDKRVVLEKVLKDIINLRKKPVEKV